MENEIGDMTSPAAAPFRVLMVRAGALGDTLMVTPAIREFRREYPEAEIDFLASAAGAELLASNSRLSHIHVLRHRNLPYWLSREKRQLVNEIRSRSYRLAVLLEAAPQYRELLERAAIPEIRSFRETPFDPKQHSIVNYIRASGLPDAQNANLDMEAPSSADALRSAEALFDGLPRPVVAIHPGYGPAHKKKDQANRLRGWDPGKFSQVAESLTASGASIVFTGSPADTELCRSIARSLPPDRYRILAGHTSVAQFVAAVRFADLMISVDSASAHIAAAVGTPLIVLWGPAILAQTRPVSSTTPIVLLQKSVPCAPCYGTPLMKSCQRNICMERIEPEEVLAEAKRLLGAAQLRIVH